MTPQNLNEFFAEYPDAILLKVDDRFFLKSHKSQADYHASKTGKKVTTFTKKDLKKSEQNPNNGTK
jgi:hypothetical protein